MRLARGGAADRWLTGLLVLAALLFCFYKLTYPDLQMWDEADNIGVLLESADAGHPFQLQRDGVPYFDKPHLWYALTQALILVLGRNELAFRLVAATAGLALLLLVIFTARRLFTPLAGLAAGAFMLAVRHNFFFRPGNVFSTHHLRSADSDALLILFMVAAFAMLALRVQGWRPGLVLAAVSTALGLLAKGPWALMPAAGFILFEAVSPQRISLSVRELATAAGAFILVAVPWHLAMLWIWGATFFDQYIAYVGQRVTAGLPGHMPPASYYVRVLTDRGIFFGYELSLVAIVAVLGRRSRLWRFERVGALLTLACIAVVLQIAKTKIAWYVLPLYPFLALIVAALVSDLEELSASTSRARAWAGTALLVAITTVIAPFAARNAVSLARLKRGSTQAFFSSLRDHCAGDTVYADPRSSAPIHYLTLRYGMREGAAGSGTCTVTRTDTALPEGFVERHREVQRGGGYVLWRMRPLRISHSSRRGGVFRVIARATARA